ncbi:uncharacterized mitochondrial protein AtMg00810-like [Solanum verrucosum]|uniref:uncharacterized mitochondrial protein AtMg00810-like n=1 Tax=Solanum verrucosum TaxID=315347 RepID=UPI0020D040C2|nr:uncharacterized mitochondrial protein AtMg00810-like [Solanum verrucosum]
MVTVGIVIALAAAENWPLFQMDMYNAFLQRDLLEEVFMEIPKGLQIQGEKHMDTKRVLHQSFKIKDLGELNFFLGIKFSRSKKGIRMNQRKYALELLAEAGLTGGKVALTPLECNMKLTIAEMNDGNGGNEFVELFEDVQQYQRMIGKLLYLTITRPDISYTVQTLNQFMQRPTVQHWNATLRVLRYIKTQPGLGLLMSSEKDMRLTGYCDADWASCPHTRRSVIGYILKLGESLIAWKSKKQATVSRSSAEAAYRSLAGLTVEVVWVTNLVKELEIQVEGPTSIYCDSKVAIQITANLSGRRSTVVVVGLNPIGDTITPGVVLSSWAGNVSLAGSQYQLPAVISSSLLLQL